MKSILLLLRKLKKNQTATSLGIAGLIVGLVCVMYIFLWVSNETSYDRFHDRIDRIFTVHAYLEGGKATFKGCPPAVGPVLKNEYPEVENSCRYIPPFQESSLAVGVHKYMEKIALSDFSLFDIFTFPFIYGDKGEADVPNRIILTQTSAVKYFGSINPVGKLVRFNNTVDLIVAGVVKDIPGNSSISFDAVVPLEAFFGKNPGYLSTWYNNSFMTFGLLKNPKGYEKVASTITRRIQKELPGSTDFLRAYKFKDGYLYEQNHIRNVQIFTLIALLVLLAATLNFINLSTARSLKQIKENGLRKTFGATRLNLIRLVYTDTAIICFMAFSAAIVVAFAGLPLFNQIIGGKIDYTVLVSWKPIVVLILIYFFTVMLAGSYPAFSLSKYTPVRMLVSNFQTTENRSIFRNSLIGLIFVVSILLLGSTLVISKQTRFMQRMDLGFEKDQLMFVSLRGKLKCQCFALKEEIGRSSDVISSTIVSNLPSMIGSNSTNWGWEGKDPNFAPLVTILATDEDFLKTFGAKIIEGKYFVNNQKGIVINKTFADITGLKNISERNLNWGGTPMRVLGVIDDIRFNSLSQETEPMAIYYTAENWSNNYLIVKINTDRVENAIKFLTKICESIEPDIPVNYGFVDDEYAKMLTSEIKLGKLVGIFSGFAIVVLCLGMLGFVIFMAEQKTKEIGVRKCLGEKVSSIVVRFIKPFLITGIFAAVIAIPLTWLMMNRWLQNYTFRIHLNVLIFISASVVTIALGILTVGWQCWKAATRNPVVALRNE